MAEFIKKDYKIEKIIIGKNEYIPNNSQYPVIIYRQVFAGSGRRLATFIEKTISGNKWPNIWRSSIYKFHHFHSTTFEFIGCYSGSAKLQLGGEQGPVFDINCGDAIVIPPGVGHKSISSEDDFILVGGYPYGDYPDMMYGKKSEQKEAIENIKKAAVAELDPILEKKFKLLLDKKDVKVFKFNKKNSEK